MAYMTNREFAEHMFKQEKRNAYTDALIKEVRQLREEKQEREKGCEYCNVENKFTSTGRNIISMPYLSIYVAKEQLSNTYYLATSEYAELRSRPGYDNAPFRGDAEAINFCPMCGKSLKEDANER